MKSTFLFFLVVFYSIISLGQCVPQVSGTSADFWPAPIVTGTITINVQVIDLNYSGTSAISLPVTISAVKSYLNNSLSPFHEHNIAFNFYSDSVVNIDLQSDAPNYRNYLLGFTPNHTNRVYVILGEDNSSGGFFSSGQWGAEDVPGTKCIIQTLGTMDQTTLNYYVAHELGHCLGLFHPHENSRNFSLPFLPYAQCGQTGDLICDTPPSPSLLGAVDNLCEVDESKVNPMTYKFPPVENVMSYTHPNCATEFTCQQGAKMRFVAATLISQVIKTPTSPHIIAEDLKDIVITTNTTWSDPKYVRGIRIKSGKSLTISNTTVYVYPSQISYDQNTDEWIFRASKDFSVCATSASNCGSIVVEKGAELIISNARITTAECFGPFWWEGIFVEGDRSLPQTSSNQGKVTLVGATIEHARNAIQTRSFQWPDQLQHHGGIVHASGSTFLNNRRDVEFLSYRNISGAIENPNISFFLNCTFKKDVDYHGSDEVADLPLGLTAWDVKGVLIRNCDFINDITSIDFQRAGYGISSHSASYVVDAGSSFEGWQNGINCLSYCAGIYDVKIEASDFSDNEIGAYISASTNVEIRNNEFEIPRESILNLNSLPVGLYLDASTSYVVEENSFEDVGTATDQGCLGLVVNNSGAFPNLINNNYFDNFLEVAVGAYEINKNDPSSSPNGDIYGLQFKCNDFGGVLSNTYDIFVDGDPSNRNYGVSEMQGSSTVGAYNLFSNVQNKDLFNLAYHLNYFHSLGSRFEPFNPGNSIVTVHQTGEQADYSEVCSDLFSDLTSKSYSILSGRLVTVNNELLTNHSFLAQLIDGGSTPSLESQILLAGQSEYQQLYLDLMALAPYVSEENLINVLTLPNFSELAIRNLMIANPHSSRSNEVMNHVYNHNPPFIQQTIEDIEAMEFTITTKDVVESEIASLEIDKTRILSAIIKHYGSDSSGAVLNSLRQTFQSQSGALYKYQLVDFEINTGNYSQALTELNNLGSSMPTGSLVQLEYADLSSYYSILISAGQSATAFNQLDSADLFLLQNLAENGEGRSKQFASNLLTLNEESSNYNPSRVLPASSIYKSRVKPQNSQDVNKVNPFIIFPNPADNYIVLRWDWFRIGLHSDLEVYLSDVHGRKVISKTISEFKDNTTLLNLEGLHKGVYYIEVIHNDETLQIEKISVL